MHRFLALDRQSSWPLPTWGLLLGLAALTAVVCTPLGRIVSSLFSVAVLIAGFPALLVGQVEAWAATGTALVAIASIAVVAAPSLPPGGRVTQKDAGRVSTSPFSWPFLPPAAGSRCFQRSRSGSAGARNVRSLADSRLAARQLV